MEILVIINIILCVFLFGLVIYIYRIGLESENFINKRKNLVLLIMIVLVFISALLPNLADCGCPECPTCKEVKNCKTVKPFDSTVNNLSYAPVKTTTKVPNEDEEEAVKIKPRSNEPDTNVVCSDDPMDSPIMLSVECLKKMYLDAGCSNKLYMDRIFHENSKEVERWRSMYTIGDVKNSMKDYATKWYNRCQCTGENCTSKYGFETLGSSCPSRDAPASNFLNANCIEGLAKRFGCDNLPYESMDYWRSFATFGEVEDRMACLCRGETLCDL